MKKLNLLIIPLSLLLVAGLFPKHSVSTLAEDAVSLLEGEGTKESPYRIKSIDDFNLFRDAVNGGNTFKEKFIELESNISIECEHASYTSIGSSEDTPFKGTFDGNGFTISMYVNDNTHPIGYSDAAGLFGYTDDALIKNIELTGGKYDIFTVLNSPIVGGLVGRARDTIISNINSTLDVDAEKYGHVTNYCGGLVGELIGDSKIVNCNVNNEMGEYTDEEGTTGVDAYLGGIAGHVNVTSNGNYGIFNCSTGITYFGGATYPNEAYCGIVGNLEQGFLVNCLTSMTINNNCWGWDVISYAEKTNKQILDSVYYCGVETENNKLEAEQISSHHERYMNDMITRFPEKAKGFNTWHAVGDGFALVNMNDVHDFDENELESCHDIHFHPCKNDNCCLKDEDYENLSAYYKRLAGVEEHNYFEHPEGTKISSFLCEDCGYIKPLSNNDLAVNNIYLDEQLINLENDFTFTSLNLRFTPNEGEPVTTHLNGGDSFIVGEGVESDVKYWNMTMFAEIKSGSYDIGFQEHTHNLRKVNALDATAFVPGYQEYYICDCGERYEDENGAKLIEDFNTWAFNGGDGYIPSFEEEFFARRNYAYNLVLASYPEEDTELVSALVEQLRMDLTKLTYNDQISKEENLQNVDNVASACIANINQLKLATKQSAYQTTLEELMLEAEINDAHKTEVLNKILVGSTIDTIDQDFITAKGMILGFVKDEAIDEIIAANNQDPLKDESALNAAKTAINAAENIDDVDEQKELGINEIEKAQAYELGFEKGKAIGQIITLAGDIVAEDFVNSLLALINQATTKVDVSEQLSSALAQIQQKIDESRTDDEENELAGCQGSLISTSAILCLAAFAGISFLSKKKETN